MVGVGGVGGGGRRRSEVVVVGRAEIDTRAPFRSVKEAVVLFGERVLAGELSAGRRPPSVVTENRVAATRPNHHAVSVAAGAVTTGSPRAVPPVVVTADQLEEAKQKLVKEVEKKQKLAGCIQNLQEELSHTMRELNRLKTRDDEAGAKVIDVDIDEGLKFTEAEKEPAPSRSRAAGAELLKKRYVTFADPPTVATVAAPPHNQPHHPQPLYYREPRIERQMSVGHEATKAMTEKGRRKKKPLIPFVGALFTRRKKSSSGCDDNVAF